MLVTIYGKPGCSHCEKAKLLCNLKGYAFEYQELGTDFDKDAIDTITGQSVRTFPQIFVMVGGQDKHVGGFDQFQRRFG